MLNHLETGLDTFMSFSNEKGKNDRMMGVVVMGAGRENVDQDKAIYSGAKAAQS